MQNSPVIPQLDYHFERVAEAARDEIVCARDRAASGQPTRKTPRHSPMLTRAAYRDDVSPPQATPSDTGEPPCVEA